MIVDTLIISPTMICDHATPTIKTFSTADRSIDVDFTFISRYEENETNDIRKVLKEEVVEKYHWDLDRDLGN